MRKIDQNIFLIGFMGAGKSSVSLRLGNLLNREVVEMDARIAALEGMSVPDIFAQKGEPYFRGCETALLNSIAAEKPCIVSCGGGVAMRKENVEAMRSSGTVVLLTARPEIILERVRESNNRPLLQGHKEVPYISALMEQRRPKYELAADLAVDTSDKDITTICQTILQLLNAE